MRYMVLWLDWVSDVNRMRRSRLVAAARVELGEKTFRLHLHVLICLKAGIYDRYFHAGPNILRGKVPAAKKWSRGMARFRAVEVGDSAVSYFTKGINNDSGADTYEIGKFNSLQTIWLSEGAKKLVAARMCSSPDAGNVTSIGLIERRACGDVS